MTEKKVASRGGGENHKIPLQEIHNREINYANQGINQGINQGAITSNQ